jgi:hypothetical protein
MRTVLDEHGIPATIFDEYTHPRGLYYHKAPVTAPVAVKVAPVVEAPKKASIFGKKK